MVKFFKPIYYFMKRSTFLHQAALATLATSLPLSKLFSNTNSNSPFGIQLWTIKEVMANDPMGTLKLLAEYGYKQIESFENFIGKNSGMFWGMKPAEFKKTLDDLGMKIISSHCDYTKDFEKKVADAASIGMKYLICAWKGPQKSIEDFKKFATEFNKAGEICKKAGLRFAYHNHDYSFKMLDGLIPQDVMIQNTDPNLVDFEMDMYWVVYAGINPLDYFTKYPDRFKLAHIKDLKKFNAPQPPPPPPPGLTPEQMKLYMEQPPKMGESCIIGIGSIDFKSIIPKAKKLGLEYTFVEQEAFTGTTIMEAAKADAAYMKGL